MTPMSRRSGSNPSSGVGSSPCRDIRACPPPDQAQRSTSPRGAARSPSLGRDRGLPRAGRGVPQGLWRDRGDHARHLRREPDDAEVMTVHDLAERFTAWPGVVALAQANNDRCSEDGASIIGDDQTYVAGWYQVSRSEWEAGGRLLQRVLLRPSNQAWTGPSGLLTAPGAIPTTVVPASPALRHVGPVRLARRRRLRPRCRSSHRRPR